MRKFLCIALTLLIVFMAVGCSNEDNVSKDTVHSHDDTISTEISYSENIRKNGELPDTYDQLTSDEKFFYNKMIFDAIQTLDISIIEEFAMDEATIATLQSIKSNEEYCSLYQKTIGEMIYICSTNNILCKDNFYVYSKFYQDAEKENLKLPDHVTRLSHEQVNNIYKKYYDNTPYIIGTFNEFGVYCKITDGKIKYNIDKIFANVGYSSINSFNPKGDEFIADGYALMLLHNQDILSYTDITKEGNCPQYKVALSLKLDDFVSVVETIKLDDEYEKEFYEEYFKDKENRKKIQRWIDNGNVEAVRAGHTVKYYIKTDVNTSHQLNNFTKEEKENIKDLKIAISGHIGDFEKTFSTWYGYRIIAETMKERGLLQ